VFDPMVDIIIHTGTVTIIIARITDLFIFYKQYT
jgi:hypothetical protein